MCYNVGMSNITQHLKNERLRREHNPAKSMLERSRKGAKKRGIEFSIVEADISPLPEHCPVLGIKLNYLAERGDPAAASIDRIDNALGYIQNNVMVVSYRANTLKSNATVEEMERVLSYMAEHARRDDCPDPAWNNTKRMLRVEARLERRKFSASRGAV